MPFSNQQQVVSGVTANPLSMAMATDTNTGTTTNIAYTAALGGTALLTATFVATSTAHVVTVSGSLGQNSGVAAYAFMAPQVADAGSIVVWPAADVDAAIVYASLSGVLYQATRATVVSGLTVGATYTVTAMQRCSTGSAVAQFADRRITVQ